MRQSHSETCLIFSLNNPIIKTLTYRSLIFYVNGQKHVRHILIESERVLNLNLIVSCDTTCLLVTSWCLTLKAFTFRAHFDKYIGPGKTICKAHELMQNGLD